MKPSSPLSIVFFGSFQRYSVVVLEKLTNHFDVLAVITTAPKPAGRHMTLTPTAVAIYARENGLPVYELADLATIPNIPRPDYIVVAGYREKLPPIWLSFPKIIAVNMHPSLLPDYRGAFPGEWVILHGETKTGVTILSMSEAFDRGGILSQKEVAITATETRDSLYEKLFSVGADLLVKTLSKKLDPPKPQPPGEYFYARKLTREDGFVPWELFSKQIESHADELDRKLRALYPWPGIWTILPDGKRLKLISLRPRVLVQLEGKTPIPYSQFVFTK